MLLFSPVSKGQIPTVDLNKGVPFAERQLFDELRNGKKAINDPVKAVADENRRAITLTAQWIVYRLNMAPWNGEGEEVVKGKEPSLTEDKPITKLMQEAKAKLVIPSPSKGPTDDQQIYINEFGKAMEKELVFVIKNASKPIVRVNAARMLAQTAQMPYAGLADSFIAILKNDNELEAVKMYACEGLRDLLLHNDKIEPKKHFIVDVKKQAEIANTLIAHIMRPVPAAASDPEVARVVHFTRREAVRALAVVRESVIRAPNRDMLAFPALPLLKIAMGDPTMVPPPSIPEQVEALIGFCSMRIDRDMDLGASVKGVHFAMMELNRKQNPDPNEPGREKTVAWKVVGARLNQVMLVWKTNAEDVPVIQEPKLVYDYTKMISDSLLTKFEEGGLMARPDAPTLNDWVNRLSTRGKLLLKNDAKSSIELGEAPATPMPPPKK
jgi:hypothetical protein